MLYALWLIPFLTFLILLTAAHPTSTEKDEGRSTSKLAQTTKKPSTEATTVYTGKKRCHTKLKKVPRIEMNLKPF